MKSKGLNIFIMIVVAILIGCTHLEKVIPVPTDNTIVETEPVKKWPKGELGFWTAMTFTRLSFDPNVRNKFMPIYLYKIASCIMKEYEIYYDFPYWRDNIGNHTRLNQYQNPADIKMTYDISVKCASKYGSEQAKELQKNSGKLKLEDAV